MRRVLLAGLGAAMLAGAPMTTVWKFERVDRIGGHAAKVEGTPHVIQTAAGKAIQFGGVKDALFVDVHPLAGAETFTWEVIFRPDADGAVEQRFFHFQQPGVETRMLFELRIREGKWCLDSYVNSAGTGQALMNAAKLHSLGEWHHAAAVYDGHEYRNYVDGELEGKAEIKLAPQGEGKCSIGTRINRVNYFKGAILLARMTRRALGVGEFLKVPEKLRR